MHPHKFPALKQTVHAVQSFFTLTTHNFLESMPHQPKLVFIYSCSILVGLDFRVLVFVEGGKPQRNSLNNGQTNNILNQHVSAGWNIEPGRQWWESSPFITAPSLLPLLHLAELFNSFHTHRMYSSNNFTPQQLQF